MNPKLKIRVPDSIRRRGIMEWPDFDTLYPRKDSGSQVQGKQVIDHPFCDMKVVLDSEVLGEKLLKLISIGDYELEDLVLYEKYLEPGDVVLEIGGGVGITAAYCAQITGSPLVVIEPNSKLHPLIKENLRANDVGATLISACVSAEEGGGDLDFYCHSEFWRSTLIPDSSENYDVISVPQVSLDSLLIAHSPEVLVVDVEGAEVGLFKKMKQRPRKIFVEIHSPNIGEKATAEVIGDLIARGYSLKDFRGWMFYFERTV